MALAKIIAITLKTQIFLLKVMTWKQTVAQKRFISLSFQQQFFGLCGLGDPSVYIPISAA